MTLSPTAALKSELKTLEKIRPGVARQSGQIEA